MFAMVFAAAKGEADKNFSEHNIGEKLISGGKKKL